MDHYIGEIRLFALPYAPEGWLSCNGQQISSSQNSDFTALIYLITGHQQSPSTATLPNLNGRAIVGAGAPAVPTPNVSVYTLGQSSGSPTVTLDNSNGVSKHSHEMMAPIVTKAPYSGMTATPGPATELSRLTRLNPTNNSAAGILNNAYATVLTNPTTLSPKAISTVGGVSGQATAHENRQPFLAMTYCICYDGSYPSPD